MEREDWPGPGKEAGGHNQRKIGGKDPGRTCHGLGEVDEGKKSYGEKRNERKKYIEGGGGKGRGGPESNYRGEKRKKKWKVHIRGGKKPPNEKRSGNHSQGGKDYYRGGGWEKKH